MLKLRISFSNVKFDWKTYISINWFQTKTHKTPQHIPHNTINEIDRRDVQTYSFILNHFVLQRHSNINQADVRFCSAEKMAA